MELYLIRHGETDWNKEFLIQGQTDNVLNEMGKKQAREVSSKFMGITPNKLYSSPLTRAQQTMEILADTQGWNLAIELIADFTERNFGEFEGKHFLKYKEATSFDPNNTFEVDEVIETRVNRGLETVIAENSADSVVLITAHSHTLKAAIVSNFAQDYDYGFSLPNCAIVHLRSINDQLELIEII